MEIRRLAASLKDDEENRSILLYSIVRESEIRDDTLFGSNDVRFSLTSIRIEFDKSSLSLSSDGEAQVARLRESAEVDDRKSARQRGGRAKGGLKKLDPESSGLPGVGSFFGITAYMISHGLGDMNTEASFIIDNVTDMALLSPRMFTAITSEVARGRVI